MHTLTFNNTEKSQKNIFSKKVVYVNFKLTCYCNFMHKVGKSLKVHFCCDLKNLILGPFWPLLVQKPQNKIFPQKIILGYLKTLWYCNFMQKKSEKFYQLFFIKLEKHHFWALYGPFQHKNPRTRFFQKFGLHNFSWKFIQAVSR